VRRFAAHGAGYAAHSVPWFPPLLAGLVSTLVVAARHGHEAAAPLEAVAIALACGAGFAFDDPAFQVLAASPTPLWRRRLLRLLVVMPPTVLLWLLLLRWQGTASSQETLALAAQFAGLVGLSLGVAGVASRSSSRGVGGIAVAPTLFVALILSTTLPPRWRPLPLGDIPGGWLPIYLRWTAAAVIGALISLLSSRDPATSVRSRLARRVRVPSFSRTLRA